MRSWGENDGKRERETERAGGSREEQNSERAAEAFG